MVIDVGKLGVKVKGPPRMFRLPVVATCELALEKFGLLAVTSPVPTVAPRRVPFTDSAPAGMVTLGVRTSTAGLLLTRPTTTPPAGAACGMVIGIDAFSPSGTLSVAGTVSTLGVTVTTSDPG